MNNNACLLISQICVMHLQERQSPYARADYMNASTSDIEDCPSAREALFNWGYQTIAACNGVTRSTAVKAFSYFDRFCSTSAPAARQALRHTANFQLAFIACLVVALKIHSGFNVETDFVSSVVCSNEYSPKEICDMEMEVIRALGWKLNEPIPHDFIDYYIELVPWVEGIHSEFLARFSKGLVEQALTKYSFALHYPSELAIASIYCVLRYTDFNADEVLSVIETTLFGMNYNNLRIRVLVRDMTLVVHELLSDPESNAVNVHQPRQVGELDSAFE
ncbi:hypothetical protein ACHAXN_002521 [Cyclotella atomus]